MLLKNLNPLVFQNQLLRLLPLTVIKIIGFSDDLFFSRDKAVKLQQPPEESVQWVLIWLQDRNQAPEGITGALLVTSCAHHPVALKVKERRLQGRGQFILRCEGKRLGRTVFQRSRKGVFHRRKSRNDEAYLLLQRLLFCLLQTLGNRKVVSPADRRRLPGGHDQRHGFMKVRRLAVPKLLHPLS